MVAVFSAFGLADMIVIKSLGIGMAIAVLLDATVIRALLVPATMRLLGRRAWWAPARLSGLTGQLGFSHTQTAYECDSPGPPAPPEPASRPNRGRPVPGPAAG
jgi:RND superfamily putative drug exporter